MTELGFEATLEAELVIYQGGACRRCVCWKANGDWCRNWRTPAVAPGTAALASFPFWVEVLAHQQQAVSKVWMVDAQPPDNGLGRCSSWSRVGEPCPGSPQ